MIGFVLPLLMATAALPAADAAAPPETRLCLQNRDIRAQRTAADTGYFVKTSKGWWRNTGPACSSFGSNRILVSVRPSDTQCRGDVVNSVDSFSRIDFGACALGSWERVETAQVPSL